MELEEFVKLYNQNPDEESITEGLADSNLRILYQSLRDCGLAEQLTENQAISILNGCASFRNRGYQKGYYDATGRAIENSQQIAERLTSRSR